MKHVDVDVYEVSHLRYDWTCPACESQYSLDVFDGDHAQQTIKCKNCGVKLFSHGPGDYGTERPR